MLLREIGGLVVLSAGVGLVGDRERIRRMRRARRGKKKDERRVVGKKRNFIPPDGSVETYVVRREFF